MHSDHRLEALVFRIYDDGKNVWIRTTDEFESRVIYAAYHRCFGVKQLVMFSEDECGSGTYLSHPNHFWTADKLNGHEHPTRVIAWAISLFIVRTV